MGLSDAEVARKAGLTPTRYGHYVNDIREPDLATVVRICRVLAMRPDELLGFSDGEANLASVKHRRLTGFAAALDEPTLDVATAVMQALAATSKLREAIPPDITETADVSPPRAAGVRKRRTQHSTRPTRKV